MMMPRKILKFLDQSRCSKLVGRIHLEIDGREFTFSAFLQATCVPGCCICAAMEYEAVN